MTAYLTLAGDYYEGEQAHPTDREVSQRPNWRYTPVIDADGVFVEWAAAKGEATPTADDAMRSGLLKVWRLADPVSAAQDPDYKVLAAAQASDEAQAAQVSEASDVIRG